MSKFIKKVQVEQLFGQYDYTIEQGSSDKSIESLIIIYGDNGSGKTTLLELIFYLLSTRDNAGHKSKIAKIKFKEFSILLSDDVEILASRVDGELIGSFDLTIKENGQIIHNVSLKADSELIIKIIEDSHESMIKFNKILKYIDLLDISIHYLSDSRKLFSGMSVHDSTESSRLRTLSEMRASNQYIVESRHFNLDEDRSKSNELESSVNALEEWIKKKVLHESKIVDTNTNTIYTDLIKKVSNKKSKKITKKEIKLLLKKLVDIREENKAYYNNGLVSNVETEEIETILLESSTDTQTELIYKIIEPYVDALRGRLDSLKEIQETIQLFKESIDDYFSNKKINYHISKGFSIINIDINEDIKLKMLSSGEKQLFLLFCYVITSSNDASIFIIDEPEISLNIKWQRKLIKTLLEFAKSKNVQFIFASHSIELLSSHSNSVRKLESTQ